jgi:hypothetical protein
VKRINHQEAYNLDGACTNAAEEFFSRRRRAEIGHHYHLAGAYLERYAREAAFREDRCRVANGEQFKTVLALVAKNRPSRDFCGYWQRAKGALESISIPCGYCGERGAHFVNQRLCCGPLFRDAQVRHMLRWIAVQASGIDHE